MKRYLRSHFLPSDFEQFLYLKYHQCTQGMLSINLYVEEFYRLCARNNLNELNIQLIARYLGGLNSAIRGKLELSSIWNLSQAINFARKVEVQISSPSIKFQSKTGSKRE